MRLLSVQHALICVMLRLSRPPRFSLVPAGVCCCSLGVGGGAARGMLMSCRVNAKKEKVSHHASNTAVPVAVSVSMLGLAVSIGHRIQSRALR